jgi:hypothetical protein
VEVADELRAVIRGTLGTAVVLEQEFVAGPPVQERSARMRADPIATVTVSEPPRRLGVAAPLRKMMTSAAYIGREARQNAVHAHRVFEVAE